MVTIGALLLTAGTVSAHPHPETTVARGVVFHDADGDGQRTDGEPGIPGVLVSDGVAVVKTDARGRYQIEIDADDSIVFVIKPAGYQVPLDGQNKPRHFYIHKPAGSPDADFNFPGVDPTGSLPPTIDFALTPTEHHERFTAILFGDPQPYDELQIDLFRAEVIDPLATTEGNKPGAAFGISLGDLVGDRLDLFEDLNQAQSMLNVPWYNVYGNHDVNFRAGSTAETTDDPDRWSDETFNRVYGPTDYAFQYGNAHFIVLDNVVWQGYTGDREGVTEGWPRGGIRPQNNNYRGGLREHQLDFVGAYLEHVPAEDLIILVFHIPLEMEGAGVHRVPERGDLFRVLSGHPNTLSVSGHTHIQRHWFFGERDGYRPGGGHEHHHLNAVTASGSWYNGARDELGVPHTTMACGAPNGYTLLHVDGSEYRTEFRAARRPVDHQMSLHVLPPATTTPGMLHANVFNGYEHDRVEFRVVPASEAGLPASSWMAMTWEPKPDPLYVEMYEREQLLPEQLRPSWGIPRPKDSYHLWHAPLPAFLPSGTHSIEVRARDMYGVENTERASFRVE